MMPTIENVAGWLTGKVERARGRLGSSVKLYFNENEPYAAAWLENLYPQATIDHRSITDVKATDLAGFRRCHFFAGIGGWEYALQLAGWPEDREVWTGSCPCQPFSVAGKRKGTEDARHLWPDFFGLIAQRRPTTVFGEQVGGPAGREWLSRVFVDMEALGYAVAGADLPAACVGAPHIRQRLFWVAHRERNGLQGGFDKETRQRKAGIGLRSANCGAVGRLVDAASTELQGQPSAGAGQRIESASEASRMFNAPQLGRENRKYIHGEHDGEVFDHGCKSSWVDPRQGLGGSSVSRQFWDAFDVIYCRDKKARRIESGSQCLVDGVPFRLADGRTSKEASRIGLLKGLGNAIVPPVAAVFVRAFLAAERELEQKDEAGGRYEQPTSAR